MSSLVIWIHGFVHSLIWSKFPTTVTHTQPLVINNWISSNIIVTSISVWSLPSLHSSLLLVVHFSYFFDHIVTYNSVTLQFFTVPSFPPPPWVFTVITLLHTIEIFAHSLPHHCTPILTLFKFQPSILPLHIKDNYSSNLLGQRKPPKPHCLAIFFCQVILSLLEKTVLCLFPSLFSTNELFLLSANLKQSFHPQIYQPIGR